MSIEFGTSRSSSTQMSPSRVLSIWSSLYASEDPPCFRHVRTHWQDYPRKRGTQMPANDGSSVAKTLLFAFWAPDSLFGSLRVTRGKQPPPILENSTIASMVVRLHVCFEINFSLSSVILHFDRSSCCGRSLLRQGPIMAYLIQNLSGL